jgi:hypothetical protein
MSRLDMNIFFCPLFAARRYSTMKGEENAMGKDEMSRKDL